jgi:CPA1 family monovalent cation:H+ antiporter
MNPFTTIAVLIFLAALFGYLNSRYLRLAPTIGLMLLALIVSLLLIALHFAGLPVISPARQFLGGVDFNRVLLNGLLSYLLFAGALDLCLESLTEVRWQVLSLATIGVLGSTVIVGFALFGLVNAIGLSLPLGYCLLFGALISPTDPLAVLPIMRRARANKRLEVLITGESLFNDGFAVVVFVVLLMTVTGTHTGSLVPHALLLFVREAIGGFVFGLALGWFGYRVLKTIDDFPVEIIITLALVSAGYAVALALGISGPLAMVVAGIVIGNQGRARGMSPRTVENLDRFWQMVDVILNAVLFVIIGLEVLLFIDQFSWLRLVAGIAAIPIVLFARFVSVGAPMVALKPRGSRTWHALPLITWAGLRGAIPVALALSLPAGENRNLIIAITYVVVVFSVLVQGNTLKYLVGHKRREQHDSAADPPRVGT